MTDAHQSIKTQKGNPAPRAPHQHHRVSAFSLLQNNAVFQERALRLLPSLGEPESCLDSAVLVTGGHGGPRTSERRARLSAPRPRGGCREESERERKRVRRRRRGRKMQGRKGTQGASFYRISIHRITAEMPNG